MRADASFHHRHSSRGVAVARRRRARLDVRTFDARRMTMTTAPMDDKSVALTEQEAAVYDRQIRVWGVETQRALRTARVLVSCGKRPQGASARGLCAETLKNVILAGVGEMTIRDDEEEARETTFGLDGNFLNAASGDGDGDDSTTTLAENMARTLKEMNPFANVRAETTSGRALDEESDDYFSGFDCVVVVGYSFLAAETVNAKCRRANTRFFAGFCGAFASYFFVDLGDEHAYRAAGAGAGEETFLARFAPMSTAFGADGGERDWASARKKTSKLPFAVRALFDFERAHGRPATEDDVDAVVAALRERATRAGKDASFVPEDVARAVTPSSMEMPAIDAVVGGILGQEVLKAVSGRGAPCVNFFVFDAASGCGTTFNASGVERASARAAV